MARKRDSSDGGQTTPPAVQTRPYTLRQLRAFQLVIGAAALWWLILLIGVITSSNPPILDAFLVEQSDFIVEALLESQDATELKVLNCWQNPNREGSDFCSSRTTISRAIFPEDVVVQKGVKYLLPIKEMQGEFRWLSVAMYGKRGIEPGKRIMPAIPIPATDLTRLELHRAIEDLKRTPQVDREETPPQ